MLASSDHIGLVLTKLGERMVEYLIFTQRGLRQKLWVGFSAENQACFDLRWPVMRVLAEQGWDNLRLHRTDARMRAAAR